MKQKILSFLLIITLLFTYMPSMAFAETANQGQNNKVIASDVKDNPDIDTIGFTSDTHNYHSTSSYSTPTDGFYCGADRIQPWLEHVAKKENDLFELFGTCGDNGDARRASSSDQTKYYWTLSKETLDAIDNSPYVKSSANPFVCGNHEMKQGQFATLSTVSPSSIDNYETALQTAARLQQTTGLICETDNYAIYGFGATIKSPYKTGTNDQELFEQSEIDKLDAYLSTAPSDKPIFILAHFPLHGDKRRYTENRMSVLDVLNKHGETRNIIYLWGHNHSDAPNNDPNYDKIVKDRILSYVKKSSTSSTYVQEWLPINFTYAAAGCMSDKDYYKSGSPDVKAKGLVASINNKTHEVTLRYYDISYNTLSNAGESTARTEYDFTKGTNLASTSDVHGSIDSLDSWQKNIRTKFTIDHMLYCGDYSYSSSSYFNDYQSVVSCTDTNIGQDKGLYTTGNYEFQYSGVIDKIIADKNPGFAEVGEVYNSSAYNVYCFGAVNFDTNGHFEENDINTLKAYLETAPTNRPIFILSHYPLHGINLSGRQMIGNSDKVIDLLNNYPNVVFLWGHNHSHVEDEHYGEVLKAGDSITYDYTNKLSKKLNFTYACAGGMYDSSTYLYNECNYRGLLININKGDLHFAYYNLDGIRTGKVFSASYNYANMYNVSFNSNGGNEVKTQSVAEGEKTTAPENPVKDGYVFDKWYKDKDLKTPYNFDDAVTADINLYAAWKEKSDNPITTTSTLNKTYGCADFTLSASTTVATKLSFESLDEDILTVDDSGKVSVKASGTAQVKISAAETASTKASSATVTINVAKKEITKPSTNTSIFTYTGKAQTYLPMNFDANTMDIENNVQTNANLTGYKVTVTPKANYKWSTDGDCEFTWYINKAKSSLSVDTSSMSMLSGDEKTITPTYTGDGELQVELTDTSVAKAEITDNKLKLTGLNSGTTTVKLSAKAGANYLASDSVTIEITVTKAIRISFDVDGGSDIDAQSILEGGTVTKPEDPTKEDSVFDGWYTDKTFKTEFDFDQKLYVNTTIYAKWIEKKTQVITAPDSITFSYLDPSVNLEKDYSLSALGGVSFTYQSSNNNIVSVDSKGNITVKEVGNATITVKAAENSEYKEASKTITVVVKKKAIDKPTADTREFKYTGSKQTYMPVGFDDTLMTISNNSHTSVNSNTVTVTLKDTSHYEWSTAGDCTFTFTIGKGEQDLSVNPSSMVLKVGESANFVPSSTSVTITNTDSTIAEAKSSGFSTNKKFTVTAKKAGTTTVKLTLKGSTNYEEKTIELQVKVLKNISLNFNTNGGSTIQAQALVEGDVATRPTNPTKKNCIFGNWYEDQALTKVFDFSKPLTDDTTIYAGWLDKQDQVITINDTFDKIYGDSSFSLNPKVLDSAKISYSSDNLNVASVDSQGNVSLKNAGQAHITITTAESSAYKEGSKTITINVAKAESSIILEETSSELLASTTSSLAITKIGDGNITVVSDDDSIATGKIENGKLVISGFNGGETKLRISVLEGNNYKASEAVTVNVRVRISIVVTFETNGGSSIEHQALIEGQKATRPADPTRVSYIFENWFEDEKLTKLFDFDTKLSTDTVIYAAWIEKKDQVITCQDSIDKVYGDGAFKLNASALDGASISYEADNSGVVSVDSKGNVTILKAGKATITLKTNETEGYKAGSKAITVNVDKASQSITCADSFSKTYGDAKFNLSASALTGASLTYEADNSGVVSVDNSGNVTVLKAGTAYITVNALESDTHKSASKSVKITVDKAVQTIDAKSTYSSVYGESFNLNASAKDDAQLEYVADNSGVVSVDNSGKVECLKPGTANITIKAKENDKYYSASKSVQVVVARAEQKISVEKQINKTYGDDDFTLEVSALGGAKISYATDGKGVVSVDDKGNVSINKAGTSTITVSADQCDLYKEASASVQITVDKKAIAMPQADTSTFNYIDKDLTYNPVGFDKDLMEISNNVQKNAGTYTVLVTLKDTNNYKWASGSTCQFTWTIKKANQVITCDETIDKTYLDPSFNLNANALGDASLTYTADYSGVVSVDRNGYVSVLKAGQGKVTISAAETNNYKSASQVVVINVAQKAISKPTAVSKTYVYNGANQSIELNGFDSNLMSISNNTQKNAGTYTVQVNLKDTANYKWDSEGACTLAFVIEKADRVLSVDPSSCTLKIGESINFTPSSTSLTITNLDSTIAEAKQSGTYTKRFTITAKKAGTTSVKLTLAGDSNYKEQTVEIAVKVLKNITASFNTNGGNTISSQALVEGDKVLRPNDPVKKSYKFDKWYKDSKLTEAYDFDTQLTDDITLYAGWIEKKNQNISVQDSKNETYGNSDFYLSATALGGVNLTYTADYSGVVSVDSTGKVHIQKAGDAVITILAAESNEYKEASKTVSIHVDKKSLAKPYALSKDYVYNGSNQSFAINGFDTNLMSISNNTQKNAGTYTVQVNLKDTTNYQWSDGTACTFTWTIEQAEQSLVLDKQKVEVKINESLNVNFTKSGTKSVSAKSNNTAIATASASNTYNRVAITGKTAGETFVTVTLAGDTNYKEVNARIDVKVLKQFTVKFNSNGGTTITNQSVWEGSKVTKPANPRKTGYNFVGWYLDNNTFKNEFDFDNPVSQDMTLYARWSQKQAQTIQCEDIELEYGEEDFYMDASAPGELTFSDDGSGVINITSDGLVHINHAGTAEIIIDAAETDTYASQTKRISINVLKAESSITLDKDYIELLVGEDDSVQIDMTGDGDLAYYFEGNKPSSSMAEASVLGDTLYVKALKAGETSVYVYEKEGQNYLQSEAVEVSIKVRKMVKVSFDLDGGKYDDAFKSQTFIEGGKALKPSVEPSKNAYKFVAWYTDKSYTKLFNFGESIYDDCTAYAKWIEKEAQEIDLKTTFNKMYGDSDFNLGAKAKDNSSLYYESSNDDIASVNASGVVHIKHAGSVQITVSAKENQDYKYGEKTCTISIEKADASISFDKISKQLILFEDETGDVLINYDGDGKLSLSPNNTYASFALEGNTVKVKGLLQGSTTLTVYASQGNDYKAANGSIEILVLNQLVEAKKAAIANINDKYEKAPITDEKLLKIIADAKDNINKAESLEQLNEINGLALEKIESAIEIVEVLKDESIDETRVELYKALLEAIINAESLDEINDAKELSDKKFDALDEIDAKIKDLDIEDNEQILALIEELKAKILSSEEIDNLDEILDEGLSDLSEEINEAYKTTVNTIAAKYYNGKSQSGTFIFKQNGKTIATKKVSRTKPGTYYTDPVNGVKGKLVIKVKGTSIRSLKAGKKSFTIKVYKRAKANVTGYQLRFCLKKDMKKVRIKTISTKYTKVSNTFKKLKSTRYYVQVRTYKTINGKKYYSAWSSKTKSVKVK